MTKRTVPDMKELFRQAAEIAQHVPEAMQEAAFNRALDLLVGGTEQPPAKPKEGGPRSKRSAGADVPKTSGGGEGHVDTLVRDINSTQHPGVPAAQKVLDQSLMVLQIALGDHAVDGLTPPEIARILKEKFCMNTSRQAVSTALKDATHLVDRTAEGRGYRYRIMAPGEEYLVHIEGDAPQEPSASAAPKKRAARRKKRKFVKAGSGGAASTGQKKEGSAEGETKGRGKGGAASGKMGPKAAIMQLLEKGYLDQPRSGPEIQAHLDKQKGVQLGTDQIRMAMLRLVRDEVLERGEREDGQYEYSRLP